MFGLIPTIKKQGISLAFLCCMVWVVMASAIVLCLQSCSTTAKEAATPTEGFLVSQIQKIYNQNDHLETINLADKFQVWYPYSQYEPQVLMFEANSKFKLEDWPAAIADYEDFLQRFPKDPNKEEVLFFLPLAYEIITPHDAGKDVGNLVKSFAYYKDYLALYPQGKHALDVQNRVGIIFSLLTNSKKEQGDFWVKKQYWYAACQTYKALLDKKYISEDTKKILQKNINTCIKNLDQNQDGLSEHYAF
jgi:outer membrane assembly lipoprotein YfiO